MPALFDTLLGVALVAVFAGGAWRLRGVSSWGAVTGGLLALVLYFAAGPGGFAALVAVFVLTWLSTRLGRARKQRLGVIEAARGRSAGQVLANLATAAGLAAVSTAVHSPVLLLAAMAALAEAAADTASSECGIALSERAYVITTWRPVPAGTDGGISLPGSLAGIIAAFTVAGVAAAAEVISWAELPLVAIAGIAGTVVDSMLGATLERRRLIGNNGVNFLSTLAAAAIAWLLAR